MPIVLIADDEPNIRRMVGALLTGEGYEVAETPSGVEAIARVKEGEPDVALVDLHLPDIGGEQVLQRLRDDPATASIPVVIVSADATSGQIQRLLASGASSYITKPIDVRELLGIFEKTINGRARP